MKKCLLLLVLGLCIILLPLVNAMPQETHNMPPVGNDAGETFELRFEIKADVTMEYSIIIHPGTKFSVIDGNTTLIKTIPTDETRTFVYNMQLNEDLEDGKHAIYYNATKNNTIFKSGIAYVRVGKQAPGFELALIIIASITAIAYWKKKHLL